jgi:hypothetical protein
LIKRRRGASRIVEDLEREFTVPAWAESHVDHQKDVISLVFSQRLRRHATQKKSILPRSGRAGPDRGFRGNELQVGQCRDNEPVRLKIRESMIAGRT